MSDYGHELLFGSFLTPSAQRPDEVVGLAQLSERVGLDLVTLQDHPYQPTFLDTWTLMSYLAAATSRVRLSANVLNLPLRQPVLIARSAASLDLLAGGRVELGLGAGAFWDAIEAVGGRRLSAGQSVDALDEAIQIIRQVWAADERGGVHVDGEYYRVKGAKRGPAPAHGIGIWVGAYKPRMLRLVGRAADGWLPSLSHLPGGPDELRSLNACIDEAAEAAGRDPRAVRRLLNISGRFARSGTGLLDGPPEQWAEELAGIALEHGTSGFVLMSDDPAALQLFGEEVAPAVRELVAADATPATTQPRSEPAADSAPFDAMATPPPSVRLSERQLWDESSRPLAPPAPRDHVYSPQAQAIGRHLVDVHDHLRQELRQLRELIEQVRLGTVSAASARGVINEMTMRQNDWTLGAYCASYCRVVTQHHSIEDSAVFPHLRRADGALAPVLDRLQAEHVVIHEVLEGVDRALVAFIGKADDFSELDDAVAVLTDTLLSHLSYEEQQIIEPLARFGFYTGQM